MLLNLLASNAYFGVDTFTATLSGFLSNADGTDQIPFGLSGGSINMTAFNLAEFLDFEVGENTYAQITHSMQADTGSGATEAAFVNVFRNSSTGSFERLFDYTASLAGTPGSCSTP